SASVNSSNWAAAKKSLTALYSAGSTPTITLSTVNLTGAGVVLLPKRVRVRSSGATDSFQVILPDGSITVAVTPGGSESVTTLSVPVARTAVQLRGSLSAARSGGQGSIGSSVAFSSLPNFLSTSTEMSKKKSEIVASPRTPHGVGP